MPLEFSKATVQRFSIKSVFLKTSQNAEENNCARVPFLIKLSCPSLQLKKTPGEVFSCEYLEIVENACFVKSLDDCLKVVDREE